MTGPGGRASWALRTEGGRKKDDGRRPNAFVDFRSSASGPIRSLSEMVLDTQEGLRHFQSNLQSLGTKFKNFELREYDPDALHDNRVLFSPDGIRTIAQGEKQKEAIRESDTVKLSEPLNGPRLKAQYARRDEMNRNQFVRYEVAPGSRKDPVSKSLGKLLKASQISSGKRPKSKEIVVKKTNEYEAFGGVFSVKTGNNATDPHPHSSPSPLSAQASRRQSKGSIVEAEADTAFQQRYRRASQIAVPEGPFNATDARAPSQ